MPLSPRRLPLLFLLLLAGCTNEDLEPAASCFDGLKNQDELGVDCGGRCEDDCPAVMTAQVNGAGWAAAAANISSSYTSGSSTLNITGSPASGVFPRIQLVYLGSLALGSHALDPSTSYLPDIGSFIQFQSGTISFTSIDSRNRVLGGGFSFTCTDTAAGATYTVANGLFELVPY
jgi:hypothetical protein